MFIIRPREKILTPGEYHCCSNGTTPGELKKVDFDLSVLSITEDLGDFVDNGDGTGTTTWTIGPTGGAYFYDELTFYVCCARSGTFAWTQEVSPFGYEFRIDLNGAGDTVDITSSGTIDFDDPIFTQYADPNACVGLLVAFRATNGPTTISITI